MLDTGILSLGAGQLNIDRYSSVDVKATSHIIATGSGALTTIADFTATTPFITAAKGVNYSLTSLGHLGFDSSTGNSNASAGGLGSTLKLQGDSVTVNSDVLLPSGSLTLRATGLDAADGWQSVAISRSVAHHRLSSI